MVCAFTLILKNERIKRENNEIKILRTGKPLAGRRSIAASIFLTVRFIKVNNLKNTFWVAAITSDMELNNYQLMWQ